MVDHVVRASGGGWFLRSGAGQLVRGGGPSRRVRADAGAAGARPRRRSDQARARDTVEAMSVPSEPRSGARLAPAPLTSHDRPDSEVGLPATSGAGLRAQGSVAR